MTATVTPPPVLRGPSLEEAVRRRARPDGFGPVPDRLSLSVAVAVADRPERIERVVAALADQRDAAGGPLLSADVAEVLLVVDEAAAEGRAPTLATLGAVHPWLRAVPVRLDGDADRGLQVGLDAACTRLLAAGRPDGLVVAVDADAGLEADWICRARTAVADGAEAVRQPAAGLTLVGAPGRAPLAVTARGYAWVGGLSSDAAALVEALEGAGAAVRALGAAAEPSRRAAV